MKYTLTRKSGGERVLQEAVVADTWVLTDHGHLQFIHKRDVVYMVNRRFWVNVKTEGPEGPQDAKPQDTPTWKTNSILRSTEVDNPT